MTNAEQNSPDDNRLPIDGSSSGGHLVSAPRRGDGQLAGFAPRQKDLQDAAGINPREYWRIVKKRKWLIGSIISAFVMIGWLQTLMSIPLVPRRRSGFRSTAALARSSKTAASRRRIPATAIS